MRETLQWAFLTWNFSIKNKRNLERILSSYALRIKNRV